LPNYACIGKNSTKILLLACHQAEHDGYHEAVVEPMDCHKLLVWAWSSAKSAVDEEALTATHDGQRASSPKHQNAPVVVAMEQERSSRPRLTPFSSDDYVVHRLRDRWHEARPMSFGARPNAVKGRQVVATVLGILVGGPVVRRAHRSGGISPDSFFDSL